MIWWGMWSRNWWAVLGLAACADPVAQPLLPPVAGLAHVDLASVGQPVTFDASTSAVASVSLDRFHLAIADGTPAVDMAGPVTQHVFVAPGSFGIELTVVDDRGRRASVSSEIRVVSDFQAECATSGDCMGMPCDSGACRRFACGGDPACPGGVPGGASHCHHGLCASTPGDRGSGSGDDAGQLQVDAY